MKTTCSILIIAVLGIFNKYTNKPNAINQQKSDSVNFEKRVNLIHSKVTDLTDIFELHHIKEFNEVYFDPIKFRDSVIEYLKKSESFENKVIVICLMTRLPLKEYIEMSNAYFVLYKKALISEDLLDRSIFNEFDTNNTLIKHYKSHQVRLLFKQMLKSQTLSKQFKISIKETLSGKRYNDLKETGHL